MTNSREGPTPEKHVPLMPRSLSLVLPERRHAERQAQHPTCPFQALVLKEGLGLGWVGAAREIRCSSDEKKTTNLCGLTEYIQTHRLNGFGQNSPSIYKYAHGNAWPDYTHACFRLYLVTISFYRAHSIKIDDSCVECNRYCNFTYCETGLPSTPPVTASNWHYPRLVEKAN